MRHGKKFNHLGRKAGHRKALLRNLAISLIEHKRINTTLAKAKALRKFVEPLVTKAKTNTMHSRRVVFSNLQNKYAVTELFGPIAEKIADRPGGYVRVLRTGFRKTDGAEMAMIEFVDFNTVYTKDADKTSGRKRRRSRKKKTTDNVAAPVADAVDTTVEEVKDTVDDATTEEKSEE